MTALAIIGSLVVVGGIIGLIARGAKKDVAASQGPIAQQNEIFLAVGKELGLAYTEDADSYGELRGERAGVPVSVRIANAYLAHWIQIRARAPKDVVAAVKKKFPKTKVRFADGEIVVEPAIDAVRAGRTRHWVILDAAELRRWIDDVANAATA